MRGGRADPACADDNGIQVQQTRTNKNKKGHQFQVARDAHFAGSVFVAKSLRKSRALLIDGARKAPVVSLTYFERITLLRQIGRKRPR